MPGKIYQLFIKGLLGDTTVIRINEEATVGELRQMIVEQFGMKEDELRVIHAGKDLRAKNPNGGVITLKDFDIKDGSNLCMVLRLRGGSDEEPVPPKMYASEGIELTHLPDMFTLEDDVGVQRALMPCGHAVGPESLTAYCRSLLTAGKYEFRCPYKKEPTDPFCDSLWEFFSVKRLAVLTDSEMKEFESKISENYLRKAVGIQDCPKCQSYCERRSKKDQRVVCPLCTHNQDGKMYEFCWFCLKTWLTNKLSGDCGNFNCAGEDPRLRIIRESAKKTVVGVPNCPAIRGCPKCGLLIEHMTACKQMTCPCGQKFCFICLKEANTNGRYQCGAWNFKCEVAPIQKELAGS